VLDRGKITSAAGGKVINSSQNDIFRSRGFFPGGSGGCALAKHLTRRTCMLPYGSFSSSALRRFSIS
jgi:hypothetical protein